MARSQRIKTGAIAVDGLAELNKALKQLEEPSLLKELRATNKEAAEKVAGGTRSRMSGLGAMGAHFAPGVRATAGALSAGVTLDAVKYPGILGTEFGAGRDKTRDRASGQYAGFNQFQPWRGNGTDAGYALYPTIRDESDAIVHMYDAALQRLIEKAGLK